jgi:hypothetical protein
MQVWGCAILVHKSRECEIYPPPGCTLLELFHQLSLASTWSCIEGLANLHSSITLPGSFKLYSKLRDAFKHQEGKMVSSASSALCIMLGMLRHLLFQSATEAD